MKHNEVSSICRGIVAKAMATKEADLDFDAWHFIIYDFSTLPKHQAMTVKEIKTLFQKRVLCALRLADPKTRNLAAKRLE